jgi:hypothetical protein
MGLEENQDMSTIGFGEGCATQVAATVASNNMENAVLDALNLSLSTIIGIFGIVDNLVVFITMATSKKMRTKVSQHYYKQQFVSTP